jgi:hypothetical protein
LNEFEAQQLSPASRAQLTFWDLTWGSRPRIGLGKAIKASEAGGSRIISMNVKRYGYHPLRGFNWPLGF